MTVKTHSITIDLEKPNIVVVEVNQNNNLTHEIAATITDDGELYDMTGLTARFAATKPDGTVIFDNLDATSIDVDEGIVTVPLTTNILAASGLCVCEIQLYSGTSLVTTCPFNLHIRVGAVGGGDAITSSNEFGALVDALVEADESVEKAATAAKTANDAATAATEAKTDLTTAVNAKISEVNNDITTWNNSVNTAVSKANTATSNANTAAENADTAREELTETVDNKIAEVNGKVASWNSSVETAVTNAQTATSNTTSAANAANSSASKADTATSKANTAATNADTARTNLTTAVNNKISEVDTKVSSWNSSVTTAVSNANTATSSANTAATNATTQADYAKEQGDYAKAQGDAVAGEIADHETRIEILEGLQPLTEYEDIQKVTRAGLAKKYLSAGEQIVAYKESALTCSKGDSTGITDVAIDEETFLAKYPHSLNGELTFIYDDSKWFLEELEVTISEYGITYTGTPVNGDEIIVHETASELDFDVLAFDKDTPTDTSLTHTLSLGLHDVFTYGSLQFSASQMLWCADKEYPAGTYNITLYKGAYDAGTNQDGTYQFTTTVAIPQGGGIRHSAIGSYQSSGYTKAQITGGTLYICGAMTYTNGIATRPTLQTLKLTEGSEGTNLGTFSAEYQATATNDEYHNFTRRNAYGDNRWIYSNYRQWLNSAVAPNTGWYTQQTNFDMPPSEATQKWAGFLHGLDAKFVAALGTVNVICANGSSDRSRGEPDYYTTEDKIFLQSMTNLSLGNNNGVAEGQAYDYWVGKGNADRVKYQGTTARYWWLRSCNPSYSVDTRSITTSGALYYNNASISIGVVPACVIL